MHLSNSTNLSYVNNADVGDKEGLVGGNEATSHQEAVSNSRMDEVQLVMFLLGITVLILTALTLKTGN